MFAKHKDINILLFYSKVCYNLKMICVGVNIKAFYFLWFSYTHSYILKTHVSSPNKILTNRKPGK